VKKWEVILENVTSDAEAEAKVLNDQTAVFQGILEKIASKTNDSRQEYVKLVNQRDDEVGALAFNPVYNDFYSIVEEIHAAEKKIEMKRHIEDHLTKMLTDLIESNDDYINKKKQEEQEEMSDLASPRTPRTPRSTILRVSPRRKKSGSQKPKKNIHGTVELFMLKKTKAEYDLLHDIKDFSDQLAQDILFSIPKGEPYPSLNESHFRSALANSESMIKLVEAAKMRTIGGYSDKALWEVAAHLAESLGVSVKGLVSDFKSDEVFDDYYIDYDEELQKLENEKYELEKELRLLERDLNQVLPEQKENTTSRSATRLDTSSKMNNNKGSSRLLELNEVMPQVLEQMAKQQKEYDPQDTQTRWLHAKLHAIQTFKEPLSASAFTNKTTRDKILNKSITGFQSVDASPYHHEYKIDPTDSTQALSTNEGYFEKSKLLDKLYNGEEFNLLQEDGTWEVVHLIADENTSDLIVQKKNSKKINSLRLRSITDVVPGHRSILFHKYGQKERQDMAFSITTASETFDLELLAQVSDAKAEFVRDSWVKSLLIAASSAKSVV
jgi:predicted RecB family endonuclease